MANADIQFLMDNIIIEALARDNSMIKNSFDVSSLAGPVISFTKSMYDPERPAGSVANILVPGILSSLGFKWLSVLMMGAEIAFGVNFTGLFQSIFDKIKEIFTSKNKIPPAQVDSIVNNSLNSSFSTGKEDDGVFSKILNNVLATNNFQENINKQIKDAIFIKKFALSLTGCKPKIIKEAVFGIKGGLIAIFGKILRWIVKLVLHTTGWLAVGGVAAVITGKNPNPKQKGLLPSPSEAATSLPAIKPHTLKMIDNGELTAEHKNDKYSIWLEPNKFGTVKDQLAQWAMDLYPTLKDHKDIIFQSSSFISIYNLFLTKNKDNASLIVIPDEFTSIKEITDYFVGDVADKLKQ